MNRQVHFMTDPHLGLHKISNTTPAKSKIWQQQMVSAAEEFVSRMPADSIKVCAGDVFDKYSNDEQVIKEAAQLLKGFDCILAGNHDVSNSADKLGSIQLLKATTELQILAATFGEPKAELIHEDPQLVAVPHVSDQTLFEESLLKAASLVDQNRPAALILHCNYNLKEEWATDTSLNLTEDFVSRNLQCFKYIILGHMHDHQEWKVSNTTIVALGNTFPLGFGQVEDKRHFWIDENFELQSQPVYENLCSVVNWKQAEEAEPRTLMTLDGDLTAAEVPAFNKVLSDLMSRDGLPLAVRSTVKRTDSTADGDEFHQQSFTDPHELLLQRIAKREDLKTIWRKYNA